MKILYLDVGMGAAGDMLSAALLELLPEPDEFIAEINSIGIPDVHVSWNRCTKHGICGNQIIVNVHGFEEDDLAPYHNHHTHHHNSLSDIAMIVNSLCISDQIKKAVLAVYQIIAEAESRVHGVAVTDIHFHEVGTIDAITDIVMFSMLIDRIAPDQVIASPVCVGSGHVDCAHGILPVPAPATAEILRSIPIFSGPVQGELCTPTGAALLKYFASRFTDLPLMRVDTVGYGMGKRNFEMLSCVRAILGEGTENAQSMCILNCNIDDMTGEEIGFAMNALFACGAKEVYTIPVYMKKSRPGTLLHVVCMPSDRDRMIQSIFRHTTTIGLQEIHTTRHILSSRIIEKDTFWGKVHQKVSSGYGVERIKYEYDDLERIAKEKSISLSEVRNMID